MASGDTLLVFTPASLVSGTATPDVRGASNQETTVLDFNDTTNQEAIFQGILPRHYGNSGVTVYLHYAMSTATSGDVDWDVAFERIGDQQQDIDSAGFAAVQSVDNTTVPGTSGLVDIVSVAFTNGAQMDSVAVGEAFRLSVIRDAVSDTATGDAELVAVEVKET